MEPIQQIQKKFGSRAMVAAVVAGMIFILAGQKSIAKGLVLGAGAYITKPYSNAELVSKVKELLENTHEKVRQ